MTPEELTDAYIARMREEWNKLGSRSRGEREMSDGWWIILVFSLVAAAASTVFWQR